MSFSCFLLESLPHSRSQAQTESPAQMEDELHGTMHSTTPHHALDAPSNSTTTSTPQFQTLTSSPSSPLQTFHLFPLLPTELRLKIYTYALPPPTLHTISLPTCPSTCPIPSCPRQHAPRTLSSLPVLLHISHESRTECLRHYTVLSSPLGKGFHQAFDSRRDSVYFSNGRGPARDFWSVKAEWPACVEGGGKIRNLVIDEATLERGDFLKFGEEVLGLESVTVLLMPWSSIGKAGGGGELVRTFGGAEIGEEEVVRGNDRDWGLKELRREFLGWLEEKRVELGREKKPVVKVAQWGACLRGGDEEGFTNGGGQWKLVETGLWVHWEYNGNAE
ncbi:uncharacterized protein LY89DRAFT_742492 [Mollisia scopiformis]|uniref:2EXR domain-containing protein n=1 Tax=Mollisia scopiformis TaxID=149040 RepID=A0A132B5N4_MOLSC|nr:uncharacterized protein LY89DRAFT_742492 [Mollisia scopiformis]KUJ07720.1 hypothetical protein LY89DRAFT_742492 [Mollisia scopiformis]